MSEMTRGEALHILGTVVPANSTLGQAMAVATDALRDVVMSEAEAAAARTDALPPEVATALNELDELAVNAELYGANVVLRKYLTERATSAR